MLPNLIRIRFETTKESSAFGCFIPHEEEEEEEVSK